MTPLAAMEVAEVTKAALRMLMPFILLWCGYKRRFVVVAADRCGGIHSCRSSSTIHLPVRRRLGGL